MDYKIKNFSIDNYKDASCFVWNGIKNFADKKSYPLAPNQEFLDEEFYKCCYKDKNAELVGCYKDNELLGVMSFFFQPEEKYLQTTCLFSVRDDSNVIKNFIDYIFSRHSGYEVIIGIEATYTEAKKILQDNFFTLEENSIAFRQTIKNPVIKNYKKSKEVVPVTKDNLEEYLSYHKEHFDELCYWTSDRIKKHLKNFKLYALYEEEKIQGCCFIQKYDNDPQYEVFGLEAKDTGKASSIIETAFVDIMENDSEFKSLLFMVEEDEEMYINSCRKLCFTQVSHYNSYKKNS